MVRSRFSFDFFHNTAEKYFLNVDKFVQNVYQST